MSEKMPAEELSLHAASFTGTGTARDDVALPAELFDGTINVPVMQQAVKAYLANQRQGNAATKIRKYVVGGNQKPWKQKGTGRARQGSIRAPHWVGGGTVFGPIPRSYAQYVPRQVRALARKSAFNARARENAVIVIESFEFDAPKTSRMRELLEQLHVADQKVLILTHGVKQNVFMSGRNMPNVQVLPYNEVSTYHLLWSDVVLVEKEAFGVELVATPGAATKRTAAPKSRKHALPSGESDPESARGKAVKKTAAKKAATKASAKAASKARASAAEKKPAAKKAPAKKPAAKSAPKKKGK